MFTHCAAQPRQEGKEDEKIHGLLQKYSDAFPITVNLIYRQLVWMMRNKDKTNTMSYPHPPWLNFPSSEGSTSHQEVQKDWELGKVCLGHNSCPSFSYLSNAPVGPLQASFPSENLLLCGASTGYNSCQESAPQATIPVRNSPLLLFGASRGPIPAMWSHHRSHSPQENLGPVQAATPARDCPHVPAPHPHHLHQPQCSQSCFSPFFIPPSLLLAIFALY